jgi:nucleotide-binding universal stress UspA family protein
MAMKNILLLIHDDKGQEARFQAALDVARAIDGHITCLDLTIIPEFVGDYAPLGGTGMLLLEENSTEAQHSRHMLARMESEDVPFDWVAKTGFLAQTIEARTGLVDLIVMSTDDAWELSPHMTHVIGDILVHTGKPVLAVPASSRRVNFGGSAMIAWDGSEDAEAALSGALPLLQHARAVTIFHVDDGSLVTSAEDAARYLSRHGVGSVIKSEPVGFDRVGEWLICEAETQQHDYIVMGGFGHARTLEAIFGGVTRKMLKECEVPMVLVHRR